MLFGSLGSKAIFHTSRPFIGESILDEALPAIAAFVDAVIGAGEDRAGLGRMDREAVDAALAPQPLLHPPPVLAAIGAEPQPAADRADENREVLGHGVPP